MKSLPKTDIEYLTHHWPVVTGCSFGCPWCWARATALLFPAVHKYPDGILAEFKKPQIHPDRLDLPLRRKKPARIGVCFTGDLFGSEVSDEFRLAVMMHMVVADRHQFFCLTKRAAAIKEEFESFDEACAAESVKGWPPSNVWAGVTVTTQAEADERIPLLLATPAAKRWVSIEPMLGPITFNFMTHDTPNGVFHPLISGGLNWVVVGSIDHPTPQFPAPRREWIESIREQCKSAGVPLWEKNNLARHGIVKDRKLVQELPV